jgi:glycine cleavage system H protein
MAEQDLEITVDKFVFRVRRAFLYTREGLWVSQAGSRCKVGVGDYLQQKSGDVAYVEFPQLGVQVQVGDVLATVETMKTSFDLVSPVAGVVAGLNPELSDHPERINEDPYGVGWLLEIECAEPVAQLLDAEAYFQVMSEEALTEAAKLGK